MPIQIVRNDITKMECDAIVNAAKTTLLGGGGVDGAIHKAAGKQLLRECEKLGGCEVGQAKLTSAYELPCKYVIHTVGPVWNGGGFGEEELLKSCYRESLKIAKDINCQSVAFPLISSGVYGYPKDKALKVAVDTISEFLLENEMFVYIVIFDKASFNIGEKLFADIRQYIDDRYVENNYNFQAERRRRASYVRDLPLDCQMTMAPSCGNVESSKHESLNNVSLDELVNQIDESFTQMLFRKIDEKGMTDSQCYKKANIDRKLFSKIRKDIYYKPSKNTALAFAIALELNITETKEMLMKAGYALSHSNKFDIIIEYFIQNAKYDVFEINEALFAFDQSLLGG